MTIRIEHGDALEVIPLLVAEGVVVDAVVTDPPYGLKFMGKTWDDPGSFVERRPDREVTFDRIGGNHNQVNAADVARTRRVEGIRQQAWHHQWARVCFEILRPGGFLLAFGGTRTHHRIWCAIEDAGFVIQDTICWLYGSGFPKGREQLKPAFEPICVAYKPAGRRELSVDECRIGTESTVRPFGKQEGTRANGYGHHGNAMGGSESGRWPANVCLSPDGGEYELRPDVTAEQRAELYRWLSENP